MKACIAYSNIAKLLFIANCSLIYLSLVLYNMYSYVTIPLNIMGIFGGNNFEKSIFRPLYWKPYSRTTPYSMFGLHRWTFAGSWLFKFSKVSQNGDRRQPSPVEKGCLNLGIGNFHCLAPLESHNPNNWVESQRGSDWIFWIPNPSQTGFCNIGKIKLFKLGMYYCTLCTIYMSILASKLAIFE